MSHKANDEVKEMIESGNWGKDFENYLADIHAENYTGTDDDMPDALDNWIAEKTPEELYQMYINFKA